MINARSRQYSSDGKTSGYVTLESIFWKYLTMYEDVGIQNNNFTYQKMIEYVNGIGSYWIDLVEQFIPASTIWNTGTNYENSIFHRQKFIYRRQVGCRDIPQYIPAPEVKGATKPQVPPNTQQTLSIDLASEYTKFSGEIDSFYNNLEVCRPEDYLPTVNSINLTVTLIFENLNTGNLAQSQFSSVYNIIDNEYIIPYNVYLDFIGNKAVQTFNSDSATYSVEVTYSNEKLNLIDNSTAVIGDPTLTYIVEFQTNC